MGPGQGRTDGVSDFEHYNFISARYKYVMLFNAATHQVDKQVMGKFVIGKERGYNL